MWLLASVLAFSQVPAEEAEELLWRARFFEIGRR